MALVSCSLTLLTTIGVVHLSRRSWGSDLYPELDFLESHSIFPNVPAGWRMWPSGTYVASPGCYAWQVDGVGFSEIITFHSLDLPTVAACAACPVSSQQVAHNLSPSSVMDRLLEPGRSMR